MQLCLKIYKIAKHLMSSPQAVDGVLTEEEIWDRAMQSAHRGSPKFANEVQYLITYVRNLAGPDASLIHELVQFIKNLMNPRVVTGQVMAAIATAKLGPDGYGCIKFRQDMLKAMFSATEKYTSPTGQQRIMDATSIGNYLEKNHDMVLQANKMKTRL